MEFETWEQARRKDAPQADELTKVLWNDSYLWDNPFRSFQGIGDNHIQEFPGNASWSYWPLADFDINKVKQLTLGDIKRILRSIECPTNNLKTGKDAAQQLAMILENQYELNLSRQQDNKEQTLRDEIQNWKLKYDDMVIHSVPLASLRQTLKQVAKLRTYQYLVSSEFACFCKDTYSMMEDATASIVERLQQAKAASTPPLKRLQVLSKTVFKFLSDTNNSLKDVIGNLPHEKLPRLWKDTSSQLEKLQSDCIANKEESDPSPEEDYLRLKDLKIDFLKSDLMNNEVGVYRGSLGLITLSIGIKELLSSYKDEKVRNQALSSEISIANSEREESILRATNSEIRLREQAIKNSEKISKVEFDSQNIEEVFSALEKFLSGGDSNIDIADLQKICDRLRALDTKHSPTPRGIIEETNISQVKLIASSSLMVSSKYEPSEYAPPKAIKRGIDKMIENDRRRLDRLNEKLDGLRTMRNDNWNAMVSLSAQPAQSKGPGIAQLGFDIPDLMSDGVVGLRNEQGRQSIHSQLRLKSFAQRYSSTLVALGRLDKSKSPLLKLKKQQSSVVEAILNPVFKHEDNSSLKRRMPQSRFLLRRPNTSQPAGGNLKPALKSPVSTSPRLNAADQTT